MCVDTETIAGLPPQHSQVIGLLFLDFFTKQFNTNIFILILHWHITEYQTTTTTVWYLLQFDTFNMDILSINPALNYSFSTWESSLIINNQIWIIVISENTRWWHSNRKRGVLKNKN